MASNRNLVPMVQVCVRILARISLVAAVVAIALLVDDRSTATTDSSSFHNNSSPQEPAPCPAVPSDIVDIKESGNFRTNPTVFNDLKKALGTPNTTVRIGADVELDFNGLGTSYFPLLITRCVTLMSVDSFGPGSTNPITGKPGKPPAVKQQPGKQSRPATKPQPTKRPVRAPRGRSRRKNAQQRQSPANVAQRPGGTRPLSTAKSNAAKIVGGTTGPIRDLEVERPRVASARTPKSPGPLFRFGSHHPDDDGDDKPGESVPTFFELRCDGTFLPDGGNGARISGFRLFGKKLGPQSSGETAIQNLACTNVEISNMEIYGWGGVAINILDEVPEIGEPGGRITRPDQVRIFNNYIHHNQHPREGFITGHAAGYGVDVGKGAWAQISHNVFDHNRHAIAASGDSGGYTASHNLVLKGGGIHGASLNYYTHQFDVHGNKNCGPGSSVWNCGHAGYEIIYDSNAFQYRKDHAIKIRGKPRTRGFIANNIFPHDGFEDDWGDDAVNLYTTTNMGFSGNKIEFDSFGKYGVCDFDADGVDDLFLATGVTWWYSSSGKYPWSYMSAKSERPDEVRLGYVDNDGRCDVITQRNGQLLYSSGGYGDWQSMGLFDAPFKNVAFGRFDPAQTDTRPGATRQTTHAFWQRSDSQWFVVPLASLSHSAAPPWKDAQSSGKELNFGDFTGDGVTDVLAVVGGRWAYSESAQSGWQELNAELGDDVDKLKIVNLDKDDNIDDILKLERKTITFNIFSRRYERTTLTWWRSKNGRNSWKKYSEHSFYFPLSKDNVSPRLGFVGRFGAPFAGGTLVIGHDRFGSFFSAGEMLQSEFAY